MDKKVSAKPAKGTRDLFPEDIYLRNGIYGKLIPIYEKYGGVPIQTPILERMDIVHGLYGEEFDKSVFTLDGHDLSQENGEGSEKLLLRYDLTVPFARLLADNGLIVYRRYQIGPVYRKDNVNINRGRFREFVQADFDIIGNDNGQMIQETEILNLLVECLESLISTDTFTILINSRMVISDFLSVIGIDDTLTLPVCSTLDKLDKLSDSEWIDCTTAELIQKSVPSDKISGIISFIKMFKGSSGSNRDKLTNLLKLNYIKQSTYDSISCLLDYIDMTGISRYIVFTPTLSRGLDYYTGLIYEVVYNDKNIIGSSIAAGGRYNNLVGKLSHQKDISAIGVSIGIDRIVNILENRKTMSELPKPLVYVASVGSNMLTERLKLLIELRKNGIYADMSHSTNPKMKNQLNQVFDAKIPYMILIGESEIQKGTVALKNIYTKEQTELDRHEAIKLLKSIMLSQ